MKGDPEFRPEKAIRCRHTLDQEVIDRLIEVLSQLPGHSPHLVSNLGVPAKDFPLYFNAAIQSIRGTTAASTAEKQRFLEALFGFMQTQGAITGWKFVGTKGRQDFQITLKNGRMVGIEAKGCPDGNNMNIWDRPAWAEEFIVWSQCPDSLANQPGEGVWSGIATRLLTKVAVEGKAVDAFVFYDGRCGSAQRRCWKRYGVQGLRSQATGIPGQDGRDWLPPPCIYLFPRTVPNPRTNPRPPLHSLQTCQFANALLDSFGVPVNQRPRYVHWASIELKQDEGGIHKRVAIGYELGGKPILKGRWRKLKRE